MSSKVPECAETCPKELQYTKLKHAQMH